jgi:hypothetical protein
MLAKHGRWSSCREGASIVESLFLVTCPPPSPVGAMVTISVNACASSGGLEIASHDNSRLTISGRNIPCHASRI